MLVARTFHISPWEVAQWSQRQLLVALDWIDREWNNPSLSDLYQMQTAHLAYQILWMLCHVWGDGSLEKLSLQDMKLQFGSKERSTEEPEEPLASLSPDDPRAILERSIGVAWVGGKVEKVVGAPWWENQDGRGKDAGKATG